MPTKNNRRRSTLRQMRLVSIGTLVVALFTLGLILVTRAFVLGAEQGVKENISLTIELTGDNPRQQYDYMAKELDRIAAVKSLAYIDADEAARQMTEQLGENPVEVLGYNPLISMARLSLKAEYMNADSLAKLRHELGLLGIDASLDYRSDLVEAVEGNMRKAEYVLWGLLVLQAIFAFIQINNTTRLMIHADRLKIRTLSLVGASPWFVRRPIILRSMCDALIAAVLAVLLLGGAVYALESALSMSLIPVLQIEHILVSIAVLLIVAVLGGMLASMGATRRYIRMDGNKIHLI